MSAYLYSAEPRLRADLQAVLLALNLPCVAVKSPPELLDFLRMRERAGAGDLVILHTQLAQLGTFVEEYAFLPAPLPSLLIVTERDALPHVPVIKDCLQELLTLPLDTREALMRIQNLFRYNAMQRRVTLLESDVTRMAVGDRVVLESRDPATGLAGRATFVQFLHREWNRCTRYDWPISLALLKLTNSRHEPLPADTARKVGGIVTECARRPGDLAAMVDEGIIAVVLSETDSRGCIRVCTRIREELEAQPFFSPADRLFMGHTSTRPLADYRSSRTGGAVLVEAFQSNAAHALAEAERTGVSLFP